MFIVVFYFVMTQSGNFWIQPHVSFFNGMHATCSARISFQYLITLIMIDC